MKLTTKFDVGQEVFTVGDIIRERRVEAIIVQLRPYLAKKRLEIYYRVDDGGAEIHEGSLYGTRAEAQVWMDKKDAMQT